MYQRVESTVADVGRPKSARSGVTVFRPRARLIRLLGEGLISDEVMAVTEPGAVAYRG
jgi:hypothetical protein